MRTLHLAAFETATMSTAAADEFAVPSEEEDFGGDDSRDWTEKKDGPGGLQIRFPLLIKPREAMKYATWKDKVIVYQNLKKLSDRDLAGLMYLQMEGEGFSHITFEGGS